MNESNEDRLSKQVSDGKHVNYEREDESVVDIEVESWEDSTQREVQKTGPSLNHENDYRAEQTVPDVEEKSKKSEQRTEWKTERRQIKANVWSAK